jgi:hypothetical protein
MVASSCRLRRGDVRLALRPSDEAGFQGVHRIDVLADVVA